MVENLFPNAFLTFRLPGAYDIAMLIIELISILAASGTMVFILFFSALTVRGMENRANRKELLKQPKASEKAFSSDALSELEPLAGESVDYDKASNWLRIPKLLKKADTFFLYPTIFSNSEKDAPAYSPIDSAMMRVGAEYAYFKDGMAFEDSTNVFAPFYRQSNLAHIATYRDEALMEAHRDLPRTDVYGALDYYFRNFNNGRPFILAGHSQGAIMTLMVLEEYMKAHPTLYERMIAAYVVGYSVTKEDLIRFPHLKFAEGETDTGCIISWNTEGPKNKDADSIVVRKGAVCINPINWKRDDTYAPASDNLGSRIDLGGRKFDEKKPGLADARIDLERGVVICTNEALRRTTVGADIPDPFGPDSFHGGDYPFYFNNVRENARKRVEAFYKKGEIHVC